MLIFGAFTACSSIPLTDEDPDQLNKDDLPKKTIEALNVSSSADFSSTQGSNNWYFGYFENCSLSVDTDCHADFSEFPTYFDDNQWWGTSVHGTQDYSLTLLSAEFAHPSIGHPQHPLILDVLQSAVRRWISPYSGTVQIQSQIHMPETGNRCGDGVTAFILLDGIVLEEHQITFDDTVGIPGFKELVQHLATSVCGVLREGLRSQDTFLVYY